MKYIVTGEEMKRADTFMMERVGIPSLVLMERAALKAVEVLKEEAFPLQRVLVVCGSGNNGGDGMAIARLLYLEGVDVSVYLAGNMDHVAPQAKNQKQILEFYRIPLVDSIEDRGYTTVVDAVFGVGLSREVSGNYAQVLEDMNQLPARILAVDIASGIHADTGKVMGVAVHADVTVTFAFAKAGQILYPGADYSGKVVTADIGITDDGFEEKLPVLRMAENRDIWKALGRTSRSNKGTYGKVLVIAGRKGIAGAAFFSAAAAYRTGCGVVKVYTDISNREILQTRLPEAMFVEREYPEGEKGLGGYPLLAEALSWADAVVLGPGIGTGIQEKSLLEAVLINCRVPLVLDADALTLLSEYPESYLGDFEGTYVLTPHPGEMARLFHCPVSAITEDIQGAAHRAAEKFSAVCVMKDAHTVTASPDGEAWINVTGSSGMATGGSGDVLTGVIAAFLAYGTPAPEAAAFAVRLHGMAGAAAAGEKGVRGMLASDILDHLGMDENHRQPL